MIVSGDKTHITAQQLCSWLDTLDSTRHDAKPVFVRIGNTIYGSAASYTDSVGESVIYMLGPLPRSYARRALYAITSVEADDRLWYVSGYYPATYGGPSDTNHARYNPFGRMVMLRRSDVPVKRQPYSFGNAYSWLTHGNRGGLREVQSIKVIPLELTDAHTCSHGRRVWFGNECGDCEEGAR